MCIPILTWSARQHYHKNTTIKAQTQICVFLVWPDQLANTITKLQIQQRRYKNEYEYKYKYKNAIQKQILKCVLLVLNSPPLSHKYKKKRKHKY